MTWGNMEILIEDRIQVQTIAKVFEGRPKQSVPKSFFLGKSQKFNTSKNYDHIENLPTGSPKVIVTPRSGFKSAKSTKKTRRKTRHGTCNFGNCSTTPALFTKF